MQLPHMRWFIPALAFLFASTAIARNQVQAPFYAVEVDTRPGKAQYITMLSPQVFFSTGLPPEAIVGQVVKPGNEITSANFARNSIFVGFLHSVIQVAGPQDINLQKQAKRIKNGPLVLADRRGGKGAIGQENVFGTFTVVNGAITSYERNPEHRILSKDGLFQLPSSIEKKLIQELEKKARASK